MKVLVAVVVFMFAISVGIVAGAAVYNPSGPQCGTVPVGALPGQPFPTWCYTGLDAGISTAQKAPNAWMDMFNHGQSMAEMSTDYNQVSIGTAQSRFWNGGNPTAMFHWMQDFACASGGPCGSAIRPNQSFNFVDRGDGRGKTLIVEGDVAAGIDAYGGDSWAEFLITTDPHTGMHGSGSTGLYLYDYTVGYDALGCRLYGDKMICSLFDNSARTPNPNDSNPGRIFELSFFQQVGSTQCGWYDGGCNGDAFIRNCAGSDADLNCRDSFRFEIAKNDFRVYVNGKLFGRTANMPVAKQIPDRFLNSATYTYFGAMTVNDQRAHRFHWMALHINADMFGAPPVPTATPPAPTMTPPPATATPTNTPVPHVYTCMDNGVVVWQQNTSRVCP